MKCKYLGYAIYMSFVLLFTGPIFIAPFLASSVPQIFEFLHDAYALTCHQLTTRSLCYFQNGTISDCMQSGTNITDRERIINAHGIIGYKFPVCARDLAICGAMIIGGIIFLFIRKIDDNIVPPFIYFLIALVPIALDGGTQFLGLRQSTNELRLITGFIAGIVVPFCVIPMFNMLILGQKDKV